MTNDHHPGVIDTKCKWCGQKSIISTFSNQDSKWMLAWTIMLLQEYPEIKIYSKLLRTWKWKKTAKNEQIKQVKGYLLSNMKWICLNLIFLIQYWEEWKWKVTFICLTWYSSWLRWGQRLLEGWLLPRTAFQLLPYLMHAKIKIKSIFVIKMFISIIHLANYIVFVYMMPNFL